MENEFQILKNIERNKNATQRDIAKSTGMSLGNVNILIKRLLKKGLLKIEKLNPRTIRYILTPEGMKEKAELTYSYLVISYKYINEINQKIETLLTSQNCVGISEFLLVGDHDEMYHILVNKLNQIKISYESIGFQQSMNELELCSEQIKEHRIYKENKLILIWQPSFSEVLAKQGVKYINILDSL